MPAGERDLFQTVLHSHRILNICHRDRCHTDNPVHRRADVMAHIGQKLTFRQIGADRLPLRLIQLPHLLL